jgi:hypothetical protein
VSNLWERLRPLASEWLADGRWKRIGLERGLLVFLGLDLALLLAFSAFAFHDSSKPVPAHKQVVTAARSAPSPIRKKAPARAARKPSLPITGAKPSSKPATSP